MKITVLDLHSVLLFAVPETANPLAIPTQTCRLIYFCFCRASVSFFFFFRFILFFLSAQRTGAQGGQPRGSGPPVRAPAPAVLPTTSPQVQRRKLGPALQLPEARVETGAHTFGERLPPCPGVPRLKAPGPQMPRLLWVPRGGPARGKGHARVPGQRRRSPGQPQLQQLPGEQTGRRMAPRPRRQALPDILRVWEGAVRVQTSRRRSEAGGRVRAGRLPGHPQPPPP